MSSLNVQAQYDSGQSNCYFVAINEATGQIWNTATSAFETPVTANESHYTVALAEEGTTGIYEGTFPAGITEEGPYAILAYQQIGGGVSLSADLLFGQGEIVIGSAAYDPLANPVPGSYEAGTAGFDIATIMTRVGSAQINVTGPVAAGGEISVVQGDSYYAADGRAFQWTSTGWPNLASGSAQMIVVAPGLAPQFYAMTVPTAGTGSQTVQMELSSSQSATFPAGKFKVVATLADGHVATLVDSTCTAAPVF